MSLLSECPELTAPQMVRQADGSLRDMNHHACLSCRVVHFSDYATWCRAERERLFPGNFVRWTEAEHPANYPLSFAQQRLVWDHMDVWEACFDGDLSLAQARQYITNMEPLPPLGTVASMVRTLAQSKVPGQHKASPVGNFNEREWQAQRAKPVGSAT